MTRTSGTVGAALLITGTCIGAGMLGLPLLALKAGFLPSTSMFVLGWFYMLITGLLLLEVNLWYEDEISLVTMAERTLGSAGKLLTWGLFLFLFYALMVAYFSGGGTFLGELSEDLLGFIPPLWCSSALCLLLAAPMLYFGTQWVDECNRVFMVGLIISYILLVIIGAPKVEMSNFSHADWNTGALLLPIMVISFGYHNLIPSLTTYLEHSSTDMRRAIIYGSALSLSLYLIWQWVIMGIVGSNAMSSAGEGMILNVLRGTEGAGSVATLMDLFSFFAIVTSLLGVSLSLVDFLADGMHMKKQASNKLLLIALALLPPFLFSLYYPHVFLEALGYAGAFGAVTLFGLMPATMVWIGRYRQGRKGRQFLPGGKAGLLFVIIFSLFIISAQAFRMSR